MGTLGLGPLGPLDFVGVATFPLPLSGILNMGFALGSLIWPRSQVGESPLPYGILNRDP